MADLSKLNFSDLYVRLDGVSPSSYTPFHVPGQRIPGNMQVPSEYEEDIAMLRGILIKHEHDDFSMDLKNMRLRASRQVMFGDEIWVALRRFSHVPPQLDELGFSANVIDIFRRWGRRTGLIIVGGPTGAGKTTTATGLLIDYLSTYGRVAVTIEDPVEYYIQGPVGESGRCFQIQVHNDQEWQRASEKVLRWKPRFIFMGEVRTPVVAAALLRATTSGHLAICTVHGGSIEETLGAVLQLAEREMGPGASLRLADGLCGIIHQQLIHGKPNVKILQTGSSMGDPVRAAIRSNKIQTLGSIIEQQEASRQNSGESSGGSSSSGNFGSVHPSGLLTHSSINAAGSGGTAAGTSSDPQKRRWFRT